VKSVYASDRQSRILDLTVPSQLPVFNVRLSLIQLAADSTFIPRFADLAG